MTDIKLYALKDGSAQEIAGSEAPLEKSLQNLMEGNLEPMLGIRLLGSEYSTGQKHGGRIDSLGIDENSNPVIIEYKRATNENVINQGLFYLDWLLDHRAEFQLLVMKQFGATAADAIDWSAPRLLCIAGGFTRYDEYAVQQMNRNIELIRYKRFGDGLLMLELVNATQADPVVSNGGKSPAQKTIAETLAALDGSLKELYDALRAQLMALGDDVQKKTLKYYVAFKRLRNFACVEVHPNKGTLSIYVKVDPASIPLKEGFSRDVRNIGHFGTGDLEITIRRHGDLERASPFLQRSYDAC